MVDDMFSSSKGPGVIGMLLGVVVLAGFAGLGMAVFDGRFNGDNANSLENKLETQAAEILRLTNRVVAINEAIDKSRSDDKVRGEAQVAENRIKLIDETITGASSEVEELKLELETIRNGRLEYRQTYRDAVRAKAVGEKIDELEILSGKVYKSITIRSVDALGLAFTDETGPKKVDCKVLPMAMQDYYQFGEEEAEVQRVKEREIEAGVTARIVKISEQKKEQKMKAAERQKEEEKRKAEWRIVKLEAGIRAAESNVQAELRKAADYRRMHREARARGNISSHTSKARQAEEAAQRWRNAIVTARGQIADLKAKRQN